MKIVKQSCDVISGLKPMEHIEKIGRICYKSEDKIEEGTAAKFIAMLFNNKHFAMLEHYRFIMEVSPVIYEPLSMLNLKHFELTYDNEMSRYLISFNPTALMNMVEDSHCEDYGILPMAIAGIRDELIGHIVRTYGCYELFGVNPDKFMPLSTGVYFIPNSPDQMSEHEWNRHGWRSVHFVTDRGITHELVRHREETSFAQESTRYCNYGAGKFGCEITFVDQGFDDISTRKAWEEACEFAENCYLNLLGDYDVSPQFARSVLPTCTKAEIVITAPIYEWNHIINLRYYGTTGKPHPMVKELVTPLVEGDIFAYKPYIEEEGRCDE